MQRVARKETRFVGLDVHAQTIAVAVATKDGDVHAMGSISNRPESIKRHVMKLNTVARGRPATKQGRQDIRCIGN